MSCGSENGGCGQGAYLIPPNCQPSNNPCNGPQALQCGANEPLASIMQNFLNLIVGQITSTNVNGQCIWTLPCDLAGEIPGFPREENESVLCYFKRVIGEGAVGQNNTASNLGSGEGLYADKVGVDLQFKSLVEGLNISITSTDTEVTIGFSYASVPGSISATGTPGQIAYNTNYLFICVAANTWRRVPIGVW